jgi:hypothetical protein
MAKKPLSQSHCRNENFGLRIIAACVIEAVAGADHLAYLVEDQNPDDHVWLTFN